MKKLFFSVAAMITLLAPQAVLAENITLGGTTYSATRVVDREIAPGVQYVYLQIPSRGTYGTHIFVTVADLTNPNVKVEYLTANNTVGGSVNTLANIAKANTTTGHKVVAGANANFWITTETPWKNHLSQMPWGTAVSNGVMYTPPNQKNCAHVGGPLVTGAICIGTDGKAHIQKLNHVFNLVHPRIGHTMDLDDCNRLVFAGSASIYNAAYGRNKAFKPIDGNSSNFAIVEGQSTEVLMDLAPGETWHVGGDTKFIIKEVRKNAGTGTLGDHDIAVVGRDSYASVLAEHYLVGDEITLQQRFAMVDGTTPEIYQATSGNDITMTAGVEETDLINAQSGYNSNNYARTMYGTNDDGTKFITVVCGNKTGTYYGMTTKQMNDVVKHFGGTYSSQVDCGGSAQMFVDGSQVNQSTDGSGVRSVHSGMFIVSTADIVVGDPTLETDGVNTNFGDVQIGNSVEKTFNASGTNLQGDIKISISGSSDFTVSPNTIVGANQKGSFTVTYAPSSSESVSATVTVSTPGAASKSFTVSGKGVTVAGAQAIYQDDAFAYGVTAPDSYTMETAYSNFAIPQLSGATIKRVIARGDILYILGLKDTTPVVIVFDHTAKKVLRQLGTSNCVGDILPLSDIAITSDGVLVGISKSKQQFQQTATILTYRWANGDDGYATGEAAHWNAPNNSGNYNNSFSGESMTFHGSTTNGTLIYTSQTQAGSSVRFSIIHVNEKSQLENAIHNNLNSVSGYTKTDLGDMLLFPSPFSDKNVILNGTLKNGAEFQTSTTAAGVPTVVSTLNAVPAAANHTSMFRYGGKVYMVAPNVSGTNCTDLVLVDITSGVAKGKVVTVNNTSMSNTGTANVAAVGTGVITLDNGKFVEAQLALLSISNGAVTKFITPSTVKPNPVDRPQISSSLPNTNMGTIKVGSSREATFEVTGENLIEDVTVSVSGNSAFTVSPTTIARKADGTLSGTVTVTCEPIATGTISATVTVSSKDAEALSYTFMANVVSANYIDDETDRGVYAYELRSVTEGSAHILNYSLNGDARSVRVILKSQATGEETVIENAPAEKGQQSITVDGKDLVEGAYTWRVEVSGKNIKKSAQFFSKVPANYASTRGGVAICMDPEKSSFGKILVSKGFAQGIDVYYPDLDLQGTYPYAGTASNRSSSFRIAMRDNGKAYFIDYDDTAAGIYEFDPENPSVAPFNIYTGTKDSKGAYTTAAGVNLGGGGTGLCFTGNGDNTKLWVFTEDYPTGNSGANVLLRHDIGQSNTLTVAPTDFAQQKLSKSGLLANLNVNLVPTEKGIFVCQVRGANMNSTGTPGFVFIDFDGNVLMNSGKDMPDMNGCGSGVAVSADGKYVAVPVAKTGIHIYDLSWEGNKPVLTLNHKIEGSENVADETSQMAFDPAGNLYAWYASNSATNCGLHAFAVKAESPVVTTAAPMSYVVTGTATGVEDIKVANDLNSNDGKVQYYDLQGRKVGSNNLAPGLYIRVQGKKTDKVLVR